MPSEQIKKRSLQNPDWKQVVLNGGPPCFHIENDGKLCFRSERWEGHDTMHKYVSLAAFVSSERDEAIKELIPQNPEQLCDLCKWKLNDRNIGMAQKLLDVLRRKVGKLLVSS